MKGVAKRALIFGVSGQDGSLLAQYLLGLGYEVHGTSRSAPSTAKGNLSQLGISERIRHHSVDPNDPGQVAEIIRTVAPFEIFNLSGQSSVGLSFSQPREAFDSHVVGTMNILEAIRTQPLECRFFCASSGEIFGEIEPSAPASEDSLIRPCTPYGAAKGAAALMVKSYRECFGLFVCSGHLFNHESPLRPDSFVAQRIVRGVVAIAMQRAERLTLGNLKVVRDWGWAPDYVECMALMLQQDTPRDYVIATGVPISLEAFVELVFIRFGLDWKEHVSIDKSLFRPSDIKSSVGNPQAAFADLGWRARVRMPELADRLAGAAFARAGSS
jgi:GDPmannose 4,6-dehydratase